MQPDFSKAQLEATKLLLQQELTSFHIDVRNFKFDKNIIIDSIQHYSQLVNMNISAFICSELSGCYVIKIPNKDLNIILYDDTEKNEERKHWGIVHELGHIYLEHTCDGEKEEIEAHFFAAQIVTPEILLLKLAKIQNGRLSSTDICENFNCTYTASCKRIKTLSSNTWSYTEYDKALLIKFNHVFKSLRNNIYMPIHTLPVLVK